MAVRPDRARDLARRDLVDGGRQPDPPALELERPAGQLEPERGRLGVDRVGPAHHHRPGFGPGTSDQHGEETIAVEQQALAGGAQLERQPGVDHVAAGQPEVEIAALRPDRLGDLADEGDDVVIGRPFDLGDPIDVHARARLERDERLGRDLAACGLGTGDLELDPEHRLEPRDIRPDRAHLGERVARDHRASAPLVARPADVVASLDAGGVDPVGGQVGGFPRRVEVGAPPDHGEDAAACRSIPCRRRRVGCRRGRRGRRVATASSRPSIGSPGRGVLRVAGRRQHHGDRRRPAGPAAGRRPARSRRGRRPGDRGPRRGGSARARPRAWARSPASRGPRSARCIRAGRGRRRSASGRRTGPRGTASRDAPARPGSGRWNAARRSSARVVGQVRQRAVGTHPTGVRPVVAIAQPLVIARQRERDRIAPVAHGDEARLATRRAAPRRRPTARPGSGPTARAPARAIARSASAARIADRDALAGRQPVRLDHDAATGRRQLARERAWPPMRP